jgi:hypothetical protein
MEDTRRELLRKIRDALVDLFVVLARVLFFWLPGGDVAYGRALMVLHPLSIVVFIVFFFLLPQNSIFKILIICMSLLVVASQWLLGGCVITRAEQRLTGSKETIVDPFLALAGLPIDRNTRIAATLATGTSICVIMIVSTIANYR